MNYVVLAVESEGESELRSACGGERGRVNYVLLAVESEGESELRSACGGE